MIMLTLVFTGKISSDSVLARQLQAEEDKRRRVEESDRERAEFKKLQVLQLPVSGPII